MNLFCSQAQPPHLAPISACPALEVHSLVSVTALEWHFTQEGMAGNNSLNPPAPALAPNSQWPLWQAQARARRISQASQPRPPPCPVIIDDSSHESNAGSSPLPQPIPQPATLIDLTDDATSHSTATQHTLGQAQEGCRRRRSALRECCDSHKRLRALQMPAQPSGVQEPDVDAQRTHDVTVADHAACMRQLDGRNRQLDLACLRAAALLRHQQLIEAHASDRDGSGPLS